MMRRDKKNNRESFTERERESQLLDQHVENTLSRINHKIVIISGKGGVGKTTVAANLALAFAKRDDCRVGLLDADIDGPNIPKMLGLEDGKVTEFNQYLIPVSVTPNFSVMSTAFLLQSKDSPIIWRGPLKSGIIKQFIGQVAWGNLDYLIVDLPPGTGDEPLSIGQLIKNVSGVIVVTTPQDVALLDSRKAVNFAKILKMPVIGILENMSGFVCPHCGKEIDLFKVGGGEVAARELGVPFLGRVPIEPRIVETGDSGKPFVEEYPNSVATKAFLEIVEKCDNFVNHNG